MTIPEIEAPYRFDDGAAYERFMGRWSRGAGKVFLGWIAPPSGARWLDVGCGTGSFTELIVDTCSPASVFAIDPEPAQIDHARNGLVTDRAHFKVGDARALPFADCTFDIVASGLVLNFIPDPARALLEMLQLRAGAGPSAAMSGISRPNFPRPGRCALDCANSALQSRRRQALKIPVALR